MHAMQSRDCDDHANADPTACCDADDNGSSPRVITCALSSCSAGEEVAALLQQVPVCMFLPRSCLISPRILTSLCIINTRCLLSVLCL